MAPQMPSAAVLVLHGGRARGTEPPPPGLLNLPGLRMWPFIRSLVRATGERASGEPRTGERPPGEHATGEPAIGGRRGDGSPWGPVLVRRVRYGHRGWNGERDDAFHDAVQALDELQDEAGDLPVILLGHSMGARAALRAGGHPLVRGVVGLAPWCPPGDPVTQLAGRDVVLLHSTRDRVTSPQATQSLATRARRAGARTCLITVRGSDHAMIRRAPAWHRTTTALVTGLLGLTPVPHAVAEVLRLPVSAEATAGTLDFDGLPAR
ncbi:alpha/beta hydrolase [Streptomyces sp. NBC_00247]|uniref:alpha/beta hydrolase n=1 Tax=Streptomyces sp. NBC_00247 TaxID=2975689 RepID=UPI002E2E088F|nr:alpha/beta fold hydrolase [Streptomyces sp. NBC_00247]